MSEQYANDAETTLVNAITSAATSLVVLNAASFPPSGDFRIRIDNEILTVTNISGNTFTVSRATEPIAAVQNAAQHQAGATVTHVLTAESVTLAGGMAIGSPVSGSIDNAALSWTLRGIWGTTSM